MIEAFLTASHLTLTRIIHLLRLTQSLKLSKYHQICALLPLSLDNYAVLIWPLSGPDLQLFNRSTDPAVGAHQNSHCDWLTASSGALSSGALTASIEIWIYCSLKGGWKGGALHYTGEEQPAEVLSADRAPLPNLRFQGLWKTLSAAPAQNTEASEGSKGW